MPEPALQAAALRYAAGDLPPTEATAFEEQLAQDQDARDALSEVVRLSAAALGQSAPKPNASFRTVLRARMSWERYRARPLVWSGIGAAVVAVCTLVGLSLADSSAPSTSASAAQGVSSVQNPEDLQTPPDEPETPPEGREVPVSHATEPAAQATCDEGESQRSVAEIWAAMSTPEHVEKTRDDEARWRQKMNSLAHPQYT
ncbi:MAG TPA: hypothetical protein VGE74_18270, partial [Gemmata sp.]